MELVYLWVEEYKNIKQQGFNFSPRFDCDLDGENLTIEEKEYTSIFPDNINITAIVGENGSGKSNLLEAFTDLLSENSRNLLEEEKYRKYIVIYKYQKEYYYLLSNIDKDINFINYEGENIDWIKSNPNQKLLTLHSDILTLILQNEIKFKRVFNEVEKIFIEEIQSNKNKIKKLMVRNIMENPTFKKDSAKFFTFTKVQIKINWHNLFNKVEDSDKYNDDILQKLEDIVNEAQNSFKTNENKKGFLKVLDICNTKKNSVEAPKLSFPPRTDTYQYNLFEVEKNYSCLSKIELNLPIDHVHNNTINRLDEFQDLAFQIQDIDSNIIDFIFDLPDYIFQIELSDEYKSFEDLSFGERQLLSQLHFILYYATHKKNIEYEGWDEESESDIIYEKEIKSMMVLLDEFEIGLHPNWQKRAILYITDFLENIKDVEFNLFFTSHSPFLLSDLPTENIIFLEDGKQKDPFKDKQTFGANIHTLLSHGFFMSDGLMGEFAKGKIEEIKKFYERVKKEKSCIYLEMLYNFKIKDFRHIESIIGEPFLQTIIKNYLDELEQIFDSKNYKLKQKKKLISQFTKKELQKYLDEIND